MDEETVKQELRLEQTTDAYQGRMSEYILVYS